MRHQRHSPEKIVRDFRIRPGRGVLFVDSQGLGDVIQTLPLLSAVCHWAEGRWPVLVLLATPEHHDLLREEELNFAPVFLPPKPRKKRSLLELWRTLAGKVDLVVCAPEISEAKVVLLKCALGARYAFAEASVPFANFLTFSAAKSWTRPWTQIQNEIACTLGIKTPLAPTAIRLRPHEILWAASLLENVGIDSARPILGVQCSAAVSQKRWPAANFGNIAKKMCEQYCASVISFGNAAERADANLAHRAAGDVPWIEGTGRWAIRQTLAMLSRVDVFVSGDTGLMHMAAALGIPTVSIFGATSAERRAPDHNGGIALCPETSCHPCFRGAWSPCECIRTITPSRVEAAVEEVFTAAAQRRVSFDLSVPGAAIEAKR